MRHFSLTYRLVGEGWAEAIVSYDDQSITLTLSYVGGDIGAAADAAIAILAGQDRREFEWLDEPGTMFWIVERAQESLAVTILAGRYDVRKGEQRPRQLFYAQTTPLKFAIQVWDALRRLLVVHGREGYAQQWRRGFPMDAYNRLGDLIREARRARKQTSSHA